MSLRGWSEKQNAPTSDRFQRSCCMPMPDMLRHAGVLLGTRLKTSTENFSRAVPVPGYLLMTHISEIDRKNLVCEPPHAMRNRMLRLGFTGVRPETGVSYYCWNQARRADQFRDNSCGWVLTCKRRPKCCFRDCLITTYRLPAFSMELQMNATNSHFVDRPASPESFALNQSTTTSQGAR